MTEPNRRSTGSRNGNPCVKDGSGKAKARRGSSTMPMTDQIIVAIGFIVVIWGLAIWSITHRKPEQRYG